MTEAMVTHGTIALRNLEAQIEGLQPEAALCSSFVPLWAGALLIGTFAVIPWPRPWQ